MPVTLFFQSSNKGQSWEPISGDLSKDDPAKMRPSGGPISIDNSSSETYGTVTAIAESSAKRGVIWAGTDDGKLTNHNQWRWPMDQCRPECYRDATRLAHFVGRTIAR